MSLPNQALKMLMAHGASRGYTIDNSLRFNDDDLAYLSRTPASAGNRKTWTWSGWVKFAVNTNYNILFGTGGLSGTGDDFVLFFDFSTSQLAAYRNSQFIFRTTARYRDPSAWYHIVWSLDTTDATANNRTRLYVNGEEVTNFSTAKIALTLNGDYPVNNTIAHGIGRGGYAGHNFDGYMAEVVFIDGQALDPTSFGEFSATTGAWVPKDISGLTYGTNGFHLDFADSAALGNDVSGNNNDWTPSGLAASDQLSDSPTNNYATFSSNDTPNRNTLSDGNLVAAGAAAAWYRTRTTMSFTSGKWYCEFTVTGGTYERHNIGIDLLTVSGDANFYGYGYTGGAEIMHRKLGYNVISSSGSATSLSPTPDFENGDVVGLYIDADAGELWVTVNGTYIEGDASAGTGAQVTWPAGSPVTPVVYMYSGDGVTLNTGQSAFTYTPPTDFLTLCTDNLSPSIAKPSSHFDIATYTGNGTAIGSGGNEISDLSFQPDFVWIKNRVQEDQHILTDAVRGATKYISSDGTDIEVTAAETLASFDSDGFTLGSDVQVNTNAENYVAWCWKAGGSGLSDTNGSISSTVSKNITAGFSIVKYTGSGANATVGHGLGAVPGLIIVKNLDQADSWAVYHSGNTSQPETDYLILDTTAATADDATLWNDTAPTSTVFSVGTSHAVNASTENYIAYCFAEVNGFSRLGGYTGNANADGPFIWCGFRPALVMCKAQSTTGSWYIFDSQREGYNVDNDELIADGTTVEATTDRIDLLSNGFKWRTTTGPNASSTYIFAAFAEHPFAYANAR